MIELTKQKDNIQTAKLDFEKPPCISYKRSKNTSHENVDKRQPTTFN